MLLFSPFVKHFLRILEILLESGDPEDHVKHEADCDEQDLATKIDPLGNLFLIPGLLDVDLLLLLDLARHQGVDDHGVDEQSHGEEQPNVDQLVEAGLWKVLERPRYLNNQLLRNQGCF